MQRSAPTAPTPPALLPRIARGDQPAMVEAIDRYSGVIWSLARRMCPTRTDAEDAVQDIFIELWRSADRFDERVASEITFVAMIARRRLVDRLRASTRRPAATGDLSDAATLPAADDAVGGDEPSLLARRAIADLRPQEQRVLELSMMRGLSHDQIASSLGIPVGTVKSLCRRGLRKVRQAVAPGLTPDGGDAS